MHQREGKKFGIYNSRGKFVTLMAKKDPKIVGEVLMPALYLHKDLVMMLTEFNAISNICFK